MSDAIYKRWNGKRRSKSPLPPNDSINSYPPSTTTGCSNKRLLRQPLRCCSEQAALLVSAWPLRKPSRIRSAVVIISADCAASQTGRQAGRQTLPASWSDEEEKWETKGKAKRRRVGAGTSAVGGWSNIWPLVPGWLKQLPPPSPDIYTQTHSETRTHPPLPSLLPPQHYVSAPLVGSALWLQSRTWRTQKKNVLIFTHV